MRLIVAILLLVLAACGKQLPGTPGGGGGGNTTPNLDVEPNDTIELANFVSVLTPPDQITFTGNLNATTDQDVYHFFTPSSEYVSFVIQNDGNVPIEAFLFARDIGGDNLTLLGHFVGDPGNLAVLNFPTIVADDGFHLVINTPAHVPTHYHVEIWTP